MACQLKHDHPTWGAGRIRLERLRDVVSDQVPAPRVLQRAFRRAPESTGHGGLAGRRGREGPARHRGGGELEPDLALWLLGLGVELAWIPPSRPRHNGKVERCKGVTQLWAEPSARGSRSVSQAQLHRECLIQREKSPSIAGRPRIEAFPGLCRIERPDRADEEDRCWELSHVDRFLGEVVLYRRAHARGAIGLYGWGRGLGRIHRGKEICMRFDTSSCYWIISDDQGQELKRLPAEELSRERIIALEVGRQRAHRQKSKTRG